MTRFVLDASAVLALLLDEPGAGEVKSRLDGSVMSTVNLAEVVSHYAKLGAARGDIETMLRPLPIRSVPVDAALSYDAGMLRPITLEGGLSLGDRCCLALARREGLPALTAERRWPAMAGDRRRGRGDGRGDPVRARSTAEVGPRRRASRTIGAGLASRGAGPRSSASTTRAPMRQPRHRRPPVVRRDAAPLQRTKRV